MCPTWLRTPLTFLTELLAAIPSIVYGLWGVFVLVPLVRSLQTSLPDWMRAAPDVQRSAGRREHAVGRVDSRRHGRCRTRRPSLEKCSRPCPPAQREGAYALGATRWEATKVALHYASTGIVGAIMLGFGRALGETMAVTMVIGNTPTASWSLFSPQYTMAAVIANEFSEAVEDLHLHALVEIGLVLFIITLDRQFRVAAAHLAHDAGRRAPAQAAAPAAEALPA